MFGAALVVLIAGTVGAALVGGAAGHDPSSRTGTYQASVDHGVALSARPTVERSPLDLQPDTTTRLFLVGLVWAVVASLAARTLSRAIEVGSRRGPPPVLARRRFDRGPPASLTFS